MTNNLINFINLYS